MQYLITATLLSSLVGAILVFLFGGQGKRAKWMALGLSLVPLILASYALASIMFGYSDPGAPCADGSVKGTGYVFHECYSWIPQMGVRVILGLDGISAPLFWLNTLLVTLGILFAWDETKRPNQFYGMLLLINVAALGVFAALDMFLFYIFWEASLIPMAFLIGIWGGPRKRYAAVKFFVYTFLASLVMLLGFMYLYFTAGKLDFSFEKVQAGAGAIGLAAQRIIFLALFIGFATKFPVVPLHTWLPDAHVEAPTAGSVLLAGTMLKLGGYGLIRIGLPMAPLGAKFWVPLMFVIAVLSMIYAAIVCLAQRDYKRLVAFSSIGSMGMVLLGIAASVQTGNPIGLVGANFMMFAHGLISPALFMLCGILAHNLGTRDIPLMGGLSDKLPRTSFWMVVFSMAGLGLPGLAAFVAEFQIFAGTWDAFAWLVFIPLLYLIVAAAYYLWAAQRALFGPFAPKAGVDYHHAYDTHWFELTCLAILFGFTLAYGVWPRFLTEILAAPVGTVLAAVTGGA
ncbi:MAG TPA: NADH-quinone oxidoreductase subunit M [Candidatus Thermoplasmatota archaeon]|nr:NADH-quinone oxidoreductase subunit M [Candidatus Thermoplasmatota archaeon]